MEDCTLKRLACKACPDKPHHPLLCSKAAANATTSSSSTPPGGPDKGAGGARPRRNNRSRKRNAKGSNNTNLPSVTYADGDNSNNTRKRPDFSVFAERLLLLLQTLHSLSTSPSSNASFKAKCRSHLEDDWFSRPLLLQCCAEVKLNLQENLVSVIGLSDNGSTLSRRSV